MYKLQVVDPQNSLNFNARYENMAKAKKPPVIAKSLNGDIVQEKLFHVPTNSIVKTGGGGDLMRRWVDDKNKEYSKNELTFWYEDEQVQENEQTKVFTIEGFQPESNYTDRYVISSYFELSPSANDMKKDLDRARAIQANLSQMRKLWEYLRKNKTVARGEFCASSRGFMVSDAYIRAVAFDIADSQGNLKEKWGLEIGVFKEEKVFKHLNEGVPPEVVIPIATAGRRKIKIV